jgi:hypothetical protein
MIGRYSWDERKRRSNAEKHGYDFADFEDVFDGRATVTRRDHRRDYGEARFNTLVLVRDRIVNVTFTPRGSRVHLISVRPASRAEREVYHARTQT